jgi:3-deoxy-D-manno-octulosonic-acid transferase
VRWVYNILFAAFFILSAPYYFFRMWRRGNWRAGFEQRFGRYDAKLKQAITNRHTLWLHAVSVGEVGVCAELIRALQPRLPNVKMVVSTTTTTGMGELQRKVPNHVAKIYYPVDRRLWVTRALRAIRPQAIVLVEAEIWPNFLWRARDMGIPLFLANARLSESSFRGYKQGRWLFARIFRSFAAVGAQNKQDAERLVKLGCRPESVIVTGSLKFDAALGRGGSRLNAAQLLGQLGVTSRTQVIVAGSTHSGEEQILGRVIIKLRKEKPDTFLVLVPRHFERANEVAAQLKSQGTKFVLRSSITPETRHDPGSLDCLLVNTTGELKAFYERAHVVFIGKSLTAEGGQNPIEPAALGKAIVFGPNMQNFRDIARSFLEAGAAAQVRDEAELEAALRDLLANQARREAMGHCARQVVESNVGAVERTVEMIVERLGDRQLYIAPKSGAGAESRA